MELDVPSMVLEYAEGLVARNLVRPVGMAIPHMRVGDDLRPLMLEWDSRIASGAVLTSVNGRVLAVTAPMRYPTGELRITCGADHRFNIERALPLAPMWFELPADRVERELFLETFHVLRSGGMDADAAFAAATLL